jgi:exodeoxyribonuclease-1
MERFHQVPWEARAKLVEQLEDRRLRELGYRLIFIEQPQALSAEKREELALWQNGRLRPAGEVPWLTLPNAIDDARDLRDEDQENSDLLSELIEWLEAASSPVTLLTSSAENIPA